MDTPSLYLNLRVAPEFHGDLEVVKGTQLWRMTLMINKGQKVARVKLTRAEKPVKNEIPLYYQQPLRQRFGYSFEGSWADIDGDVQSPLSVFVANTLSVAVSRAVGAAFEDDYGVSVALQLELQAATTLNAGYLSVSTTLEMTLDDPFGFGRNAVYDTLDALGDRGFPPDLNAMESDLDGGEEWQPAREGSEVHGDVRLGTQGEAEAYPGIDTLACVRCREEDPVHDAELYFATAPHDKYEALASVVQRCKGEGPVLVIGDHPGTLGRALVQRGIDVVGVDPLNREEDHPGGHRFGRRRLAKLELRVGDVPPWLSDVDWGAVIADTTVDGESAEVSTARNLAFCRYFSSNKRLNIAQTRSVPLVDGSYDALRLPGHSRQGCELYVMCGVNGKLHDLAYCRVQRKGSSLGFYHPITGKLSRSIWDRFFVGMDSNKTTTHFSLGDHNWYHFVVSRFFLEADVNKYGWVDNTIRTAESPLEMYANLSEYFELDDSRRSDLRSLFEGQRVTLVGGVARGLLDRVPTLRYVMSQRYSDLISLCAQPEMAAGHDVFSLFRDPRAGVLLRGLSEVRQVLDYNPLLARYRRVLPYESMSVLASRSLYLLVRAYLLSVRTVVGKPQHAWELQWLLWTLSVNGSRREKISYVVSKMRSVFFRDPTGRRAAKVSQARPVLDGFLGRLDDLRMRAAYVELDVTFGARIAKGSGAYVRQARANSSQPSLPRSQVGHAMAPPPRPPSVAGSLHSVRRQSHGFAFSGFGSQF